MSKRKIAVEDSLTNVSQELERSGYEITNLNEQNFENADAIIVSGEDNNMMDMSDIKTKAPVINARGLSAFQVKDRVKNKLT